MFQSDPETRPAVEDLINHDWVQVDSRSFFFFGFLRDLSLLIVIKEISVA